MGHTIAKAWKAVNMGRQRLPGVSEAAHTVDLACPPASTAAKQPLSARPDAWATAKTQHAYRIEARVNNPRNAFRPVEHGPSGRQIGSLRRCPFACSRMLKEELPEVAGSIPRQTWLYR